MANIAGSYFGVQDDNQFYCTPALASTDPNCAGTTVNHTVSAQNLADQLTAAGMTWKGYFQNLPPIPPTGADHDRPERERALHLQVAEQQQSRCTPPSTTRS